MPRTPSDAITALREAFERCSVERVEIACGGGNGRTGTASSRHPRPIRRRTSR
ncbi:hypothetical protein [Microbacterium sp. JAI119]|uniref:hypothetical protein n=1 Tax=Microbacterium sp. JAI119 TaxID=2723062 RepID=UPI00211BB1C6|nr:hypothetical protein [Microbacterium sp. JAI119]